MDPSPVNQPDSGWLPTSENFADNQTINPSSRLISTPTNKTTHSKKEAKLPRSRDLTPSHVFNIQPHRTEQSSKATLPAIQSPRRVSWADGSTLQQPRPRRLKPSLLSLDRQARNFPADSQSPTSPNQTSSFSNTNLPDRTDTMYQQSNKSHVSLMKSWTKRHEKGTENGHRRSRSVLGLSGFWNNSQEQQSAASRPASAGLPSAPKDISATRVRPLRRFSWQRKATETTTTTDEAWQHKEGPLVFVPAASLSPVTEGAVKQAVGEKDGDGDDDDDDEDDDDSDAATVIHRPQSTEPAPFTPRGFTGDMPRYYALANEMATLPPPSSALGVLFPGDQIEQLQAHVAQVRLELAEKERELARTKKSLEKERREGRKVRRERDEARGEARKPEEEKRVVKEWGLVKRTDMNVEEKWWNW